MSTTDLFDLTGKVALVTGGSRGLGPRDGARLRRARRRRGHRQPQAGELRGAGRRGARRPRVGVPCPWPATSATGSRSAPWPTRPTPSSATSTCSSTTPACRRSTRAWSTSPRPSTTRCSAVNLKGPFRLTSIVGTRMAEGDGGSIINVSSGAAERPMPTELPYAAAKAGINAFTIGFAKAFGPKVRVNCIQAGPFLTDISKAWDLPTFEAAREGDDADAAWRPAGRGRRCRALLRVGGLELHDRRDPAGRRRTALRS